jgi:hypothetical protein
MTNEDKPLFRDGGVYRDLSGRITRLSARRYRGSECEPGILWARALEADGSWSGDGFRCIKYGADTIDHELEGGGYRHLIPGELELRDGQWVAAEEKEEGQPDGAELIRRWAEKERARLQMERAERLLVASSNEAMVARDCTEAACLYAEQRQEAERVRAILSAPVSTAFPPLRALTLSTDLEPASHQVRAAFGSAELVRR